jgi:hypothetical protein
MGTLLRLLVYSIARICARRPLSLGLVSPRRSGCWKGRLLAPGPSPFSLGSLGLRPLPLPLPLPHTPQLRPPRAPPTPLPPPPRRPPSCPTPPPPLAPLAPH